MRTVGLLLLVGGLLALAATLVGDTLPFVEDYLTPAQLRILGPSLLALGAIVVVSTQDEG
jgi:hypothetical protein